MNTNGILLLSALVLTTPGAFAAPPQTAPAPAGSVQVAPAPAVESTETAVPLPSTAEEHMAKAEEYKRKAVAYRADVTRHKRMFRQYARARRETPLVTEMRRHCESYGKAAQALALEAEKLADLHRALAAELQGK